MNIGQAVIAPAAVAAGLVQGVFGTMFIGLALGAVGSVVGLLAAGVASAVTAVKGPHDHIRLAWEETPIEQHTLKGYVHNSDQSHPHLYAPEFELTQVGTYWTPVVRHYQA